MTQRRILVHTTLTAYTVPTNSNTEVGVAVNLSYDPLDPFALTFDFGGGITWTFGRCLLDDLLRTEYPSEPSGLGDVCFWYETPQIVMMRVSTRAGFGRFRFVREYLDRFLELTQVPVPRGSEENGLNVDRAIARILGR